MAAQNALISAIRVKLQSLGHMNFARSVGILAGGTALAQAISVLALPLITRLYTPADFSVLAVFISLLSILSISACLRLDIAIPLPEKDSDAANLLALSLCICTVASAIIGAVIWCTPAYVIGLARLGVLDRYLWLLPVGVWLAGAYSAIQFWSTRTKKFNLIARTRMTQAFSGTGVQLGMGWAGFAPLGLLLGQVISSSAGLINLLRSAFTQDKSVFFEIRSGEMRRMWRQYDRFPKYATFEALANIAGIQLPIILIAALAIGPEAGYLMLATRVMTIPMGLIGGAIAQVYLSRAAEEFRNGALDKFSAKVLSGLFKVGVGPLLAIGILAPAIFSMVFGKDWARSGELVAWMIPWFIFQFLSSPISMVMHVKNKQKEMLIVTMTGLLVRVGAVITAAYWSKNYISEIYAISGGVFYLACYFIFSRAAGIGNIALMKIFKEHFLSMAAWIAMAIVCRTVIEFI